MLVGFVNFHINYIRKAVFLEENQLLFIKTKKLNALFVYYPNQASNSAYYEAFIWVFKTDWVFFPALSVVLRPYMLLCFLRFCPIDLLRSFGVVWRVNSFSFLINSVILYFLLLCFLALIGFFRLIKIFGFIHTFGFCNKWSGLTLAWLPVRRNTESRRLFSLLEQWSLYTLSVPLQAFWIRGRPLIT